MIWYQYLRSTYNAWSLYWRNRLRWQRSGYTDPPESKEALFAHLTTTQIQALEKREAELVEQYQLQDFRQQSSRMIYLENLYLLDMLDTLWQQRHLPIPPNPSLCDIGCKNWFYVFALYHFFRKHGGNPLLTGIELDGYRVYQDFYSRRDYAEAYIRHLDGCQFIVGDALEHQGNYDVVILFFPFIIPTPLLQWGLPLKHLQPEGIIQKTWELVRPGGILLIQNQGDEEPLVQQTLLNAQGIIPTHVQTWQSDFFPYPVPRTVWVCHKPDAASSLQRA